MSRAPHVFFAALLCCGLLLLAAPPAQAAKKARPVSAQAAAQAAAQAPAQGKGDALLCPERVAIGEPFVLRLRLARPAQSAGVRFLGREAPVALRREAGGPVVQTGELVLGADVLDARPGPQEVLVRLVRGGKTATLRARVQLVAVERPVERLELDPSMVDPPASEFPRIAAEREQARAALLRATAERLGGPGLLRPVPGALSSPYGIGRVLNGQRKAPHRGLDLEAEVGQPVAAAADGVVALTGSFYYAGGCVYLDHGQGLATMYFHLSAVQVRPGQRVARGEVLGLAGDTGRSTRAHLHFGVSALGRLVDPGPLLLYGTKP